MYLIGWKIMYTAGGLGNFQPITFVDTLHKD